MCAQLTEVGGLCACQQGPGVLGAGLMKKGVSTLISSAAFSCMCTPSSAWSCSVATIPPASGIWAQRSSPSAVCSLSRDGKRFSAQPTTAATSSPPPPPSPAAPPRKPSAGKPCSISSPTWFSAASSSSTSSSASSWRI